MNRALKLRVTLLWPFGFLSIAMLAFAAQTLTRIAPIRTGYAAKMLCTGVFVPGRSAEQVIREDIRAGVHPPLRV
jgi:hypothetical protein